jgi:hypothetical protein
MQDQMTFIKPRDVEVPVERKDQGDTDVEVSVKDRLGLDNNLEK